MRIASLSPAVTEMLFAMELGDRIVCTDQFSNHPPEAKILPHLRDHQAVSVDALAAHELDLVFTSTVIQQKLADTLQAAGMSCVHLDPRTVHAVYAAIRQTGALLDADDAAEALVLSMQQQFKGVKRRAGLLPRRPRLYVEEWHDPPMASGNWVPDVVRTAGGQQCSVPAGELSRAVTLEEVAAYDPDLIVISWCGAGTTADPALLTGRDGWGSLRAVEQGNVRVIDDSLLNRPGPRLPEGAQRLYGWMFELLH